MALLTADQETAHRASGDCGDEDTKTSEVDRNGVDEQTYRRGEEPLDGMLEKLSEGSGARLSTVPVRAQAELLSRLKPLQFDDGGVIMAAGTQPKSIFFVRSGAVTVTVRSACHYQTLALFKSWLAGL